MKKIIPIILIVLVIAGGFIVTKKNEKSQVLELNKTTDLIENNTTSSITNSEASQTDTQTQFGSIDQIENIVSSENLSQQEKVLSSSELQAIAKSIDGAQVGIEDKIETLDNDLLNKDKQAALIAELESAEQYRKDVLAKAKQEMQEQDTTNNEGN